MRRRIGKRIGAIEQRRATVRSPGSAPAPQPPGARRGHRVRLVRHEHPYPGPWARPEMVFQQLPAPSLGAAPRRRVGPLRGRRRRARDRDRHGQDSHQTRALHRPRRTTSTIGDGVCLSPRRPRPPTRHRPHLRPRPRPPRRACRRTHRLHHAAEKVTVLVRFPLEVRPRPSHDGTSSLPPARPAMALRRAAISPSRPRAACWYRSAAFTLEWPRRCCSSGSVAPRHGRQGGACVAQAVDPKVISARCGPSATPGSVKHRRLQMLPAAGGEQQRVRGQVHVLLEVCHKSGDNMRRDGHAPRPRRGLGRSDHRTTPHPGHGP